MTYEETLDFLYRQLPAYQRQGVSAFKKDLTNIIALLDYLDHPQKRFKSIHIAGTNGKGSVANMMTSMLMEGGYKTALYTSPHLVDFRERIRIDGAMISKQAVLGFVRKISPVIKRIQPSFFEITVAMAFYHFGRMQVDIAVIETGLGGRLDSTNILLPELSVITRIGLEHTAMLGNSLQEIAGEKAGIIKPNVPVVIGVSQRETSPVFRKKAKTENSPIRFADKHYLITKNVLVGKYRQIELVRQSGVAFSIQSDLLANYQAENVRTAITAMEVLNDVTTIRVSQAKMLQGLKRVTDNTHFAGRWQLLQKNPLVVLDGAHNADGFQLLNRQLKEITYDKLHIIFGCVNDKDLTVILPLLPKNAGFHLCAPRVERAMPVEQLKKFFDAAKMPVTGVYQTPLKALDAVKASAKPKDLILVTGSLFLFSDFI